MTTPLTQLKRQAPAAVLAGLKADSEGNSIEAGKKLCAQARSFGLNLRDFLNLAIDPRLAPTEEHNLYADGNTLLGGYEASLAFLNLPIKNDYENGIVLQAAAETFQTFPGTKAMFPQVVDDVLQWKYRQIYFENIDAIVGGSRTVSQPELITTVVDDKKADYQGTVSVAEKGRVPVKSIRTTEQSVRFHKFGSGYEFTYEFNRRAQLDIVGPYLIRAEREFQQAKVGAATYMLINGDSIQAAAGVVNQSSLDPDATANAISRKALMTWLVNRAKAGVPLDTVLGNWDAYVAWLDLFTMPVAAQYAGPTGATESDVLKRQGFQIGGVPVLSGVVNFALSSAVPAGQLIGYSKGDTLEELVEAGSLIEESERSIVNQTVTFVRTENAGYRLVFGDTRSILDFAH